MPIQAAAFRASKLAADEVATLAGPSLLSVEAFRTGAGSMEHWRQLADAFNVGAELARRQIASDHAGTFSAAEQALLAVHGRQAERASWTLRAAELEAIDLAVFIFRVQLQYCSRSELAFAAAAVAARNAAALRGQVGRGVRVVGHIRPITTQGSTAP